MDHVNWLAILAAGISAFVLGGIWYSPALLGNAWMKENAMTAEEVRNGNKGKIFGISFLLSLVMAVNLGMYLASPETHFLNGLLYGALAGVWVLCGIAIVGLFEHRSARYILINGGYCLVALALMGGIIGAWR
ncbi:MAG TPA: DUF1761 domain-containing protein [Flavisolibacter sp.]|jgi:hypothetical protein|nr:DUF1761 domain-containing protein [Flavisolibacter sp.]